MFDSKDLINAVREITEQTVKEGEPSNVVFGTVTSVNPLKIKINSKIILVENQLVLTRNVTDFQTKISFDNPSIQQPIEVDDTTVVDTLTTPSGVTAPVSLSKLGTNGIVGKLRNVEKVKHEITVYNALKQGEKVVLIGEQGGQRYLVVDRIGVM